MNFLGDLFDEDGDEILFFIIVFLLLLSENRSERTLEKQTDANGKDFFLFFIILFGLLFLGKECNS